MMFAMLGYGCGCCLDKSRTRPSLTKWNILEMCVVKMEYADCTGTLCVCACARARVCVRGVCVYVYLHISSVS